MTFFFQAFFFIFYRKSPKRGTYPHFKSPFPTISGGLSPPRHKVAKFGKFQGFNIFENKINPIYQQIIHLGRTGPQRKATLPLLFCNFNFTFENFTLVYNSVCKSVSENIKGTLFSVLPFFLHRKWTSLNYLCLGDVLGIKRKEI